MLTLALTEAITELSSRSDDLTIGVKKMYKIIYVALIGLLISGCSFISNEPGGYFDSNTKLVEPDAAGRLESAGGDLRIYEFTPQSAQYMQCIFVAGTRRGGTFCFEKKRNTGKIALKQLDMEL